MAFQALIICGQQDQLVNSAYLTSLQEEISSHHLVTLAEHGHCPHLEDPDRIASLLHLYINGIAEAGTISGIGANAT
jgi:pimeloyl-ACP methyl ester carboxylesterase